MSGSNEGLPLREVHENGATAPPPNINRAPASIPEGMPNSIPSIRVERIGGDISNMSSNIIDEFAKLVPTSFLFNTNAIFDDALGPNIIKQRLGSFDFSMLEPYYTILKTHPKSKTGKVVPFPEGQNFRYELVNVHDFSLKLWYPIEKVDPYSMKPIKNRVKHIVITKPLAFPDKNGEPCFIIHGWDLKKDEKSSDDDE
uniref:DUF4806 domain-containing protein n=1 Tax=Rhabditophanes sp. KR3021 TaxID=114890 RepID=A0AC35UEB6_9BILA